MEENMQNIRICVTTWNVGNCEPLKDEQLEELLHISQSDSIDIHAIGLQEIKTGAKETVSSFIYYDDWAKELSDFLSDKGYFMVESVRVQGISLSLFAKLNHLPYIRFVETEIERTGIGGAWGNKGGTAISCWLYGQKVCFLNVHLSAHLGNCKGRLDDIREIFEEMEFGGKSTVLSHDLVLMFGDMNFRIDEFSREFIIETIKKKNYSVLWEEDQLKKSSQKDEIISQFTEATLDFDPTYKYDLASEVYDSSSKKRKPAWTDRIMWRVHPEVTTGKDSPFSLSVLDSTFSSLSAFKQSDHRPVSCQFDLTVNCLSLLDLACHSPLLILERIFLISFSFVTVKVKLKDLHRPLLRIESSGDWSTGSDGYFVVEIEDGMRWNSRDYENFKDFRSYESYITLERFDEASSDEEAESLAQKLVQFVNIEAGVKTKRYAMSKHHIKEPGDFRLGYYSYHTSSLVALSRPFVVKQ